MRDDGDTPKTLAEAVDFIRLDLQATKQDLDIELVDLETQKRQFPDAAPGTRVVGFFTDERYDGGRREIDVSDDPAKSCIALADQAQDLLTVWSDIYWPRCPLHDHPLNANLDDAGTPVWICPKLSEAACRIGDLIHAALD
jgi:hypothetical protein